MTIAVSGMLVVLVVAFVAWPFFASGAERPAEGDVPAAADSEWERQKVEAYGAIKELEFDFRMGKLSEADYAALRERYTARALQAIAAVEQEKPKAKASGKRVVRIAFCPSCGQRAISRAKFCARCGHSFGELKDAVA